MQSNYPIAFEQPQLGLNDQLPIQSNNIPTSTTTTTTQQINNILQQQQQQLNSKIQQQQQQIPQQQSNKTTHPNQMYSHSQQQQAPPQPPSNQQHSQHQQSINTQDLNNIMGLKKESGHNSSSGSSIRNFILPSHNPFDLNSYPMTNPPLFDSTFMLPYTTAEGIPRRRRISISNGQIGQIMNHEAFFENDEFNNSLDDDELTQRFNDYELNRPQTSFIIDNNNTNSSSHQPPPNQQQPLVQAHQQLHDDLQQPQPHPIQHHHQPQQNQSIPHHQSQNQLQHQQQLPPSNQQHLQQAPPQPPQPPKPSSPPVAGVPPPNHQLIYNNEVIYNPNNGPITGTAAWKKERLLERNRIAASKCRQRKKTAQLQLQDNVNKMENDLKFKNDYIKKLELTLNLYKNGINSFLESKNEEILKNLLYNNSNSNINSNT
ncbi:hypothetical protein KGF54_001234 [Candida jiufengensis]|uniref:uncharacterized protein n=1 Tax=Candida jiufengensis TaxID=497108 RepID=UPI0022241F76|nr:uncharacterized protein KGF54_001234 [Candida jiufengensis]KAI5955732.1 hypothetical protein KGF54_001234 [Candida jiufengensis]